jgi:apolipoprotein N-acyltransferase
MNTTATVKPLHLLKACLYAFVAVISFTLAYAFSPCAFLMIVFLWCLFRLAYLGTHRQAYYFGLAIGVAIYTPHLWFFHVTFGLGAVALWYILPCWLGLFLMLGRACLFRFGPTTWACLAPFLWTGFEFFRSESYYLRFSWLSPGLAFSNSSALYFLSAYGVYGIGFLFMAVVSVLHLRGKTRWIGFAALAVLSLYLLKTSITRVPPPQHLRVAGVQLEFPGTPAVLSALNDTIKTYPDADLFVLSEYTFLGPIPDSVKDWCHTHRKYLVAGGKAPAPPSDFYDTAFVIDTNGEIVFQQGKSVPVQFIADGLPARQQQLWNSPWGQIGFVICYDASYTFVTDALVRQGARAIINPSMDIVDWGARQHFLHGRIPPMRAAEYGIPFLRISSSGISQFVDKTGDVQDSAPFPGDGAMLYATLNLSNHGHLPPDRWLARWCVAVVIGLSGWLIGESLLRRIHSRRRPTK